MTLVRKSSQPCRNEFCLLLGLQWPWVCPVPTLRRPRVHRSSGNALWALYLQVSQAPLPQLLGGWGMKKGFGPELGQWLVGEERQLCPEQLCLQDPRSLTASPPGWTAPLGGHRTRMVFVDRWDFSCGSAVAYLLVSVWVNLFKKKFFLQLQWGPINK